MSSDQRVYIGDGEEAEATPKKLTALLNGETIEVEATGDKSILDTLIDAGHNPPYSCMDGACMACMCKISKGRVYQDDSGILTEDNIDAREALSCQAVCASADVSIDYDDI